MDLVIQLPKIAASAVGLVTATVNAVPAARGSRPETKADRKRFFACGQPENKRRCPQHETRASASVTIARV